MAFIDPIPSSTISLFCQPAAPVPGWVKLTTRTDYAIRVVTNTGGGVGGAVAFSSVFNNLSAPITYSATATTSDATALTGPQLPVHNHGTVVSNNGTLQPSGPSTSPTSPLNAWYVSGTRSLSTPPTATYIGPGTTGPIGSVANGHSHGVTGPVGYPSTCSLDFRIKYVDMIQAQKT
jgi:hypothetical protein